MTIGENIRRYRRRAGLTQWLLSRKVGVRPGTILLIERGQSECPPALIAEIAQALGVTEAELRG